MSTFGSQLGYRPKVDEYIKLRPLIETGKCYIRMFGNSGGRTAGIAEMCGMRHGLHTRDWVVRYVLVHVSLWRKVVVGLVGFPAGECLRAVLASGGDGVCGSAVVGGGMSGWLL